MTSRNCQNLLTMGHVLSCVGSCCFRTPLIPSSCKSGDMSHVTSPGVVLIGVSGRQTSLFITVYVYHD